MACALIERDGRVLVAQRPPGKSLALKWEFPGGKLEPGESAAAALVREIREELHLDIAVGEALPETTHDYGAFSITLVPFRASAAPGAEPHAAEHVALRWCGRDELRGLDWAAADVPVLMNYLRARRDWVAAVLGTDRAADALVDSVWFDVLGFVLGAGMAWAFGWKTRDLVWSLWLSSLVIGYATIVLGIFGAARRTASLVVGLAGGLFMLGFFTFHFGLFHLVHSVFLNVFFPQSDAHGFPGLDAYLGVLGQYWPWLVAAAIAERGMLREAWCGTPGADPLRGRGLSGFNPMRPYANVIRMHLLIFFFAFASFAKVENVAVYAVVYAAYFFPWRRLRRNSAAAATVAPTAF